MLIGRARGRMARVVGFEPTRHSCVALTTLLVRRIDRAMRLPIPPHPNVTRRRRAGPGALRERSTLGRADTPRRPAAGQGTPPLRLPGRDNEAGTSATSARSLERV